MSGRNTLKLDKMQLLMDIAAQYVSRTEPVPPLSMPELKQHTKTILDVNQIDSQYHDLVAILINNETWKDVIAKIPYDKRLLLLPQCLRNSKECVADFDELGLICNHCGKCCISDIQQQAEQLGYAVMIAEGSPIVMKLIETGQIESVIGVSCLAVLERTFPYIEAGAVPGVAIPLLCDGCIDTELNTDWLIDSLYLNSTEQVGRIDLNNIKKMVDSWFIPESIETVLGKPSCKTERIAFDWLAGDGKRWRPFLTASCFYAVSEKAIEDQTVDVLRKAAIAVECFHKASLIHDDIEDDDDIRYGRQTLHAEYGVPVALNVGDYLLGIGYKLIADIPVEPQSKAAMLKVAAGGHTNLCIGQGRELIWAKDKSTPDVEDVIDIFKKKTSPAFTVALKFGAILAGSDDKTLTVLNDYSDALGIAYQIRDDIQDFNCSDKDGLSLVKVINENDIPDSLAEASSMLAGYKRNAIASLSVLDNTTLKGLLRRVLSKIFDDINKMECCDDHKAEFDSGSQSG